MGNGSKFLKTWQQHEAGMSSVVHLSWHIWVLFRMYCKLTEVFIAVLSADGCCHRPFCAVLIMLLIQTV